jgi:hypothetical protein
MRLWYIIVSVEKIVPAVFSNESKPENIIDSNYSMRLDLKIIKMKGI